MAERKAISKKIRMEVFKRDSFKCQYCGQAAPDVILEIDHIVPVSKGGDNSILNLVTACRDCNRGKSDIQLDDNSVINKQRVQLEELNERRNQLHLIAEWREGLLEIENEAVEMVCKEFLRWSRAEILDSGKTKVRKWLKKFRLPDVLDAVQVSCYQYLVESTKDDRIYTDKSVTKSFEMIPRILNNKINGKPYMKELFYIRGIMRNRYPYVNEKYCMEYLKILYQILGDTGKVKEKVLSCKNWTEFSEIVGLLESEAR